MLRWRSADLGSAHPRAVPHPGYTLRAAVLVLQAARPSRWTWSSCWMPQSQWGLRTSPRCRAL